MSTNTANVLTGEGWRDSIEALVRDRIRGLIEEILEEELSDALGRARYARCKTDAAVAVDISQGLGDEGTVSAARVAGHRHGRRDREVMGTFGKVKIAVPRARLERGDGTTREWKSKTLPTDEGARGAHCRQLSFGHEHAPRRACSGVGIPPRWR